MPLRLRYYIDEFKHRVGDVAYFVRAVLRLERDPYASGAGSAPRRFPPVLLARLAGGLLVLVGAVIGVLLLTASGGSETVDIAAPTADEIFAAAEGAVGGTVDGDDEVDSDGPEHAQLADSGLLAAPVVEPDVESEVDTSAVESAASDDGASDVSAEGSLASVSLESNRSSTWSPRSQPGGELPAIWVLPLEVPVAADAARPHLNYAAWDNETAVGTEIVAMTAAVVTETSDDKGTCGGLVRLAALDRGIEILYCHLSEVSVSEGDVITAGTVVGLSGGEPGTPGAGSSDGEHLHLELRVNDELRCPQKLMTRLLDAPDGQLSDLEADVAGLPRWECIAPDPESSTSQVASAAGETGASGGGGHASPSRHASTGTECGESLGFRTSCD